MRSAIAHLAPPRRANLGSRILSSLEEWIKEGGNVGRLVTLVNIYQGQDPTARELAFREWLEEAEFFCAQCARPFAPNADRVEEEDYVLCPRRNC